jgi:hypothetical protein
MSFLLSVPGLASHHPQSIVDQLGQVDRGSRAAGLTLITIAMIQSDNRLANRIILTIFATGIGASVVLIASHSRPFTGEISVQPTVLLQVMPEAGPEAGPH